MEMKYNTTSTIFLEGLTEQQLKQVGEVIQQLEKETGRKVISAHGTDYDDSVWFNTIRKDDKPTVRSRYIVRIEK
jgi:hypothetical protein